MLPTRRAEPDKTAAVLVPFGIGYDMIEQAIVPRFRETPREIINISAAIFSGFATRRNA